MARKEHTYHYIYKTTCNITGRYYIGMHSTSNLEDGYVGSGRRLWLSIRKHGKENHSVEILEWLLDRSSLKLREKEIVNEDLLKDKMCMNLQLGGGGGFISEDHRVKCLDSFQKGGQIKLKDLWKNDSEWRYAQIQNRKDRWKNPIIADTMRKGINWTGRSHSDETKQKIGYLSSINQSGNRNSQYGKMWITNGSENMKIEKNMNIPEGWKKGRIIKK
jgi:hypothetical protein